MAIESSGLTILDSAVGRWLDIHVERRFPG
jgi:hypothetical protein